MFDSDHRPQNAPFPSVAVPAHLLSLFALALLALAAPAPVAAQADSDTAAASDRMAAIDAFKRARRAFDSADYPAALAGFERSQAAVGSPNTQLMIANCQLQLGRPGAAWDSFVRARDGALRSGNPRYGAARQAAEAELAALRPRVALLALRVLSADPGARLHLGERAIPRDRWHGVIAVAPGPQQLTLEGPTQTPVRRSLRVEAGELSAVSMVAAGGEVGPGEEVATAATPTAALVAYGLLGLSAVSAGAFAALGTLSERTYADVRAACPQADACDASQRGRIATATTQQALANASLAVGAVSLVAGVTLLWTTPERDRIELAGGPRGLQVRGAF